MSRRKSCCFARRRLLGGGSLAMVGALRQDGSGGRAVPKRGLPPSLPCPWVPLQGCGVQGFPAGSF